MTEGEKEYFDNRVAALSVNYHQFSAKWLGKMFLELPKGTTLVRTDSWDYNRHIVFIFRNEKFRSHEWGEEIPLINVRFYRKQDGYHERGEIERIELDLPFDVDFPALKRSTA